MSKPLPLMLVLVGHFDDDMTALIQACHCSFTAFELSFAFVYGILMPGTLFLIPSPLGEGKLSTVIPQDVKACVAQLDSFIVEHPKTARHFLKLVCTKKPLQELDMQILDEHTKKEDLDALLAPLLNGQDVGLISEAGCPAVADPGSDLVKLAHKKGIRVVPLVGPSSILLALMASGLGGQRFVFHGYLPVESEKQAKKIVQIEKASRSGNETQIFIETPYRNMKLFEALLLHCREDTLLCLATDITLATESILTKSIGSWKKTAFDIGKRPTVFLIKG